MPMAFYGSLHRYLGAGAVLQRFGLPGEYDILQDRHNNLMTETDLKVNVISPN